MADTDTSATKLAVSLVSGGFALLSALIPVLDRLRQQRQSAQKLKQDLDVASQQVAFWKAWLDAFPPASEAHTNEEAVKAIARMNLLRIAAKQELRLNEELLTLIPIPPRPGFKRIFFLYEPRSWIAWIPRILFYGFVAYFVVSLLKAQSSDYRDPLFLALLFALTGFILLLHFIATRMGDTRRGP